MLKEPDVTLLAEIFAAREVNDIGISSRDLAEQIPGSEYYATLPEVTARLKELARPGDLPWCGRAEPYTPESPPFPGPAPRWNLLLRRWKAGVVAFSRDFRQNGATIIKEGCT